MRRVGDDEWFSCCLFCCTGASPGNKSSKKPKLSPWTGSSTADKHYLDQEEDDAESFECVCEDGPDKSAPNYCSCCNGRYRM